MRIEALTQDELLAAYLKDHYADKPVLVIMGGGDASEQEQEALYEELEFYYMRPNMPMTVFDFCIIEIKEAFLPSIRQLMTRHNGTIRLQLYENGKLLQEN